MQNTTAKPRNHRVSNKLLFAAVTGLLAGGLVTSEASAAGDPVRDSAAKNGCGGKDGCPGKDKKKDKKKKKDKNGCSGKDGCGSKG